ncbi:MAG TPA: gamma-glutamylcyclotransferase family protein, partial [Paracoccaceae bacterium]|nr:gamma-glutamylcyclotransferase family protein [Paracoccaceae bacterium]
MTPLFFFGTLRDRELLEVVLDRAVAPDEMRPARAPDHAGRRLAGQAYPHLVEEPGAAAEGVVFRASDDELDRLAWFEEAEYGLAPIRAETADGPVQAHYFRATAKLQPGEGLWDIALWHREERAVAIEAARELMAHYGHFPVERMDEIWPGIMTRARMRARAKAAAPLGAGLRRPHGADDVEALE